ncbi:MULTISPECIES: FtsX-like permease family protein [unclassified Corynebacterium]|uniref:FtsX-like permease family protein n=1 Tax=unclassified Corynebacterium TaxID=2624378 RepID=UPI00264E3CA2|nr:ABC transporter permease [Corynebacterium sp.]
MNNSTTRSSPTARAGVAFRLARRDLASHKVRTVVAVLLFALPVSLIVGFASMALGYDRDYQNSPISSASSLQFEREEAQDTTMETVDAQGGELRGAIGDLTDSLSAGIFQDSEFSKGDRTVDLTAVTVLPSADGTGPEVDSGTVHLNNQAAFLLDAEDGDTVTVDGAELTVVLGADHQGSVVNADDVPVNRSAMNVTWYMPHDSERADEIEDAVMSSAAELPSLPSVDNQASHGSSYLDGATAATFLGFLALGILLVSAVVTPVFAVSARRQRRAMGLLSATGASPRDLRLTMLAQGIIVGLIGTVLGLAMSVGVGAALISLYGTGGFYWSWVAAALTAVVALVCGVTSALVPAIRAGKEDPVQALADGGSQRMSGFRLRMLIGPLFLIPGVFLIAASDNLVPLGIAVAGIGVVLSSGLSVWLLSRLGNILPTAGRLAVRDSLRNNHRTVPAIAAIAGTTFLAATALTLSYNTQVQTHYRDNVAVMSTYQGGNESLYTTEIDQAGERLGALSHHPLADIGSRTVDGRTFSVSLSFDDRRKSGGFYPLYDWADIRATDGNLYSTFSGVEDHDVSAAVDALAEGKAVVSNPELLEGDELPLDLREYDPYYGYTPGYSDEDPGPPDDTLRIPAVVIPGLTGGTGADQVALSPDTAESLSLEQRYQGEVFLLDSRPSLLAAAGTTMGVWPTNFPNVTVDTPAVDGEQAMWVTIPVALSWLLTLGTVLLVVMLAATESRRDMSTITAIGAGPGLLRRFSATQALFIALPGTVFGVVVGVLPRVSQSVREVLGHSEFYTGFLTSSQWLALGLTAVVGPLLAWITGSIIGAVTSRDRSPVRRR